MLKWFHRIWSRLWETEKISDPDSADPDARLWKGQEILPASKFPGLLDIQVCRVVVIGAGPQKVPAVKSGKTILFPEFWYQEEIAEAVWFDGRAYNPKIGLPIEGKVYIYKSDHRHVLKEKYNYR